MPIIICIHTAGSGTAEVGGVVVPPPPVPPPVPAPVTTARIAIWIGESVASDRPV